MNFADRIIAWQKQHGRHDLPWQRTQDAYRIWLSEIMLQQTQVATVIPYYQRFIVRFPDVRALASAPVESVMASWAGLGYYSRARNLHRCAQRIVETYYGEFPRSVEQLVQLPGIGRSTAAAIAALAFGQRAAILDGNVRRVLARQFGIEGYLGNSLIERVFWRRAESLLPTDAIEVYTQGLMDLGATVCTRSLPICAACPVSGTCVARNAQTIDKLPTPRPVRERPVRAAMVLVIRDASGAVLLELRPPSGIWGGLLSLPEFDSEASDDEVLAAVRSRFGLHITLEQALGQVRHEFTHYTYLIRPRLAKVAGAAGVANSSLRPVHEDALEAAPLPAPIRRLLLHLLKPALV
ncbi:MAG TPA: A/G-specific adenine glycosylase [Burkholderiaceae bacterium]|nr:A/G-specific adenine glycosylase [Burkholderiaceae bacterium]